MVLIFGQQKKVLNMQRDISKLVLASRLRLLAHAILLVAALLLVNWILFIVSDGYREILRIGQNSLTLVAIALVVTWVLAKKVYQLEFPFLSSRK